MMIVAEVFELNDDTVSPGLVGTLMFAALIVATVLLIRSMNRRMRNIDHLPREEDLLQEEWEAEQARKAGQP
ncbi:hypothetical protein LO762_01495 [Actinocorallia sp. API 0066]|uniref:hypothetical protein n=1 Tax=Actinocorallia sp. API 0066 TaxID=2896846 RepID=UPI001E4E2E6B|nr:hypothetical protein [Actinocorallia sp. API 0066]MCD0447875.1 hypothetical protein [Actinocorallia sp. API 0066]